MQSGNFRKITEKLYQCLADEVACVHKVGFGFKTFCSWMLRGEPGRSNDNFPCVKQEKRKDAD